MNPNERIIPVIFASDILVKRAQNIPSLLLFSRLVPFLSLFSTGERPSLFPVNGIVAPFQAGLIPIAGLAAHAALLRRALLATLLSPSLTATILFWRNARFAYRPLPFLETVGLSALMGSVSRLAALYRLGRGERRVPALARALLTGAPYPRSEPCVWKGYPQFVSVETVRAIPFSRSTLVADYRIFPPGRKVVLSGEAIWIEPLPGSDSPNKAFRADLARVSQNAAWRGKLAFRVLYYPRWRSVSVTLDGASFAAQVGALGRRERAFAPTASGGLERPALFALELSGLPARGLLEVKTRFRGSPVGNALSLATAVGLAIWGFGALL
ncbi:MAG: hypothetical protein LBO66_15330, partial [Deltaproteobacteria bacterium]|nr:hypothetical protein [Deltaproteobacteria bacterium]